MYTDNPVRDAEIIQLHMDKFHEEQAEDYAERVTANMNDLSMFKSFLWDIDPDAAEVQAFFGCRDESPQDKVFAYDILMNLFEEYCHEVESL